MHQLEVTVRRKQFHPATRVVLSNINFVVRRRDFVSILAPSGAGKTTLLRLVAGLDTTYEGDIYSAGNRVVGPGRDRGLVFQESRLLPWLTVEGNISFAVPASIKPHEMRSRTNRMLKTVGLSSCGMLHPHQLSGGMERRVALARALVNLPDILLLDEPLSSLDLATRYALQDEVAAIHTHGDLTSILVTHDVDEALFLSDRILILGGTPTSIMDELDVTLPRTRNRSDSAYYAERERLLTAVLGCSAMRSHAPREALLS